MLRYVYRWCVINVSSSTSKISERGSCFHVCPVFSASAVWSRSLLIRKFKPGGILLNLHVSSVAPLTHSFEVFGQGKLLLGMFLFSILWHVRDRCVSLFQFRFEVFWQGKLLYVCLGFPSTAVRLRGLFMKFKPVRVTLNIYTFFSMLSWPMCDQCLQFHDSWGIEHLGNWVVE